MSFHRLLGRFWKNNVMYDSCVGSVEEPWGGKPWAPAPSPDQGLSKHVGRVHLFHRRQPAHRVSLRSTLCCLVQNHCSLGKPSAPEESLTSSLFPFSSPPISLLIRQSSLCPHSPPQETHCSPQTMTPEGCCYHSCITYTLTRMPHWTSS